VGRVYTAAVVGKVYTAVEEGAVDVDAAMKVVCTVEAAVGKVVEVEAVGLEEDGLAAEVEGQVCCQCYSRHWSCRRSQTEAL